MSKPVIIGAGLAGLSVALALAPLPCVVVSPRTLGKGCSSAWAQGGIAAAVGTGDNASLHARDTLAAGAGLNDAAIVRQVTGDGVAVISRLMSKGVIFDCERNGTFRLGLEAAHSKRRIVHATDATGRAVMNALIAAARATPSIEIIENTTLQELIVDEGITGVVLRNGGNAYLYNTNTVVMASGGAAALWRDTTNPHENWGGGLALAARAGATLGDLEFMQFHPTAIDIGRDPMPLASEALRGEGAVLIDERGERFIDELQPRDIVARAISERIGHGHRVFLDARQALGSKFGMLFPTINALCAAGNIDPATMPIPVRPAAHYHMGGIVTDVRGRSDLPGLWACGEAACTGLHGANRLASNSLLEAASFGHRVGEDIKGITVTGNGFGGAMPQRDTQPEPALRAEIRKVMSDAVGVTRNGTELSLARNFLSPLTAHSDMALLALVIVISALEREESRGAHFRADFPETKTKGVRSSFRLAEHAPSVPCERKQSDAA
jgi:L-aspartate oxidase